MKKQAFRKAQIPNPALHLLSKLVGKWNTSATHPQLPGKIISGYSSFEWIEGGAFLKWSSAMDEQGVPSGIAILGSDEATGELFMLYFDERKVSRKYDVSVHDNGLSWWRNAPGFCQRCSWTFTDDANTIISKGELNKSGTNWEPDLAQVFTRVG